MTEKQLGRTSRYRERLMMPPKGLHKMQPDRQETILFRDETLTELMIILSQRQKANAVITAEPGAGKTALVEGLARLLQNHELTVPFNLRHKQIYELDLEALKGGYSTSAIQEIIRFATAPENQAILFIDEIHQLMDGKNSQLSQAAEALKPHMARGDLHVIGATTTTEYKQMLFDPAFNRRFSQVKLPPLSEAQVLIIVEHSIDALQNQHGVLIPRRFMPAVVRAAKQYMAGSSLIDNALTLLDYTTAYASLELQQRMPRQEGRVWPMPYVTQTHLEHAIQVKTGSEVREPRLDLAEKLKQTILNQDAALTTLAQGITLFQQQVFPNRMAPSFLLAGPTGTGKSQTVKQLAALLYGDESRVTTINMTLYSTDPQTAMHRLLGLPAGYTGHTSKTPTPFDDVYDQPNRIVHLEEFEKAHPQILNLFYSILEDGYIEDMHGRRIDFSKTIVIATSNALTEDTSLDVGFLPKQETAAQQRQTMIQMMSRTLPEALLNRFTHILKFESMPKAQYLALLKLKYAKLKAEALANHAAWQFVDPSEAQFEQWVESSYNPLLNGRPAEDYMRGIVESAMYETIRVNSHQVDFDWT